MAPNSNPEKILITEKLKDDPLRGFEFDDLKTTIKELHEKKFPDKTVTFEELWAGAQLAKKFGKHNYEIDEEEGANDEEEDQSDGTDPRLSFSPSVSERNLLGQRERDALRIQESLQFWREPKELLVTLITCCLAAVTQGWQQVANGNLGWPDDLSLQVDADGTGQDIWLFGAANAITWFAAAAIGCMLVDPICHSNIFGRRGAVFIGGLSSFGAVIGGSRAKSWKGYIVSRLFLGIGIGAKASIVPIWESEVLPPAKRGPLLVLWQVFTATGIFAGSVATYIFRSDWRSQVLTGAIPALLLLMLTYLSCESPRWLILQDRYSEAFNVLVRLRKQRILAAEELCFVHFQVTNERASVLEKAPNYSEGNARLHFSDRFFKLPKVPRYARAMLATMIVMLSQQLSGINILAFLASIFFSSAGLREKPDPSDEAEVRAANETNTHDSLGLTIGFGAANALFSVIAYFFIEPENKHAPRKKFHPPPWVLGRRTLLLISLAGGTVILLILTFLLKLDNANPAKLAVVMTFVILFTLFYSPGAGAVPFAYSAEVWPNEGRELGMSWAVFWNFLGAGFLALFVPRGLGWGASNLFATFTGLSGLGFLLVFLYMPATRHAMTLDEMSRKFDTPVSTYSKKKLVELKPKPIGKPKKSSDAGPEAIPDATDPANANNAESKGLKTDAEEITPAPTTVASDVSERK